MEQKQIEAEARLLAIEYLLRHLLVAHFADSPAPQTALDAAREALRRLLLTETFPTAEPAMSDHISGEIERAIDALLSSVSEHLRKVGRPQ